MIKSVWKRETGQLVMQDEDSDDNEEKCREYEIKMIELEDDVEGMGIELKEMQITNK